MNAESVKHNVARCEECGDVLESLHRHYFKTCECGNLSVDGGSDYIRRLYRSKNWTELSTGFPDIEAS